MRRARRSSAGGDAAGGCIFFFLVAGWFLDRGLQLTFRSQWLPDAVARPRPRDVAQTERLDRGPGDVPGVGFAPGDGQVSGKVRDRRTGFRIQSGPTSPAWPRPSSIFL